MKLQVMVIHLPNEETEVFNSLEEAAECFLNFMEQEHVGQLLSNQDPDFQVVISVKE